MQVRSDARVSALAAGVTVEALRDLAGFVRTAVPRGTGGTVVEVRLYGTVIVRFVNGRTLGVCNDDLRRLT
jgi:hypothetical protein